MSHRGAAPEPSPVQVFIVDDDPSFGRSLARLLSARGMNGHHFVSGRALLESGRCGLEGAIAVIDIHMPELDGFALLDKLRSDGCRWPAIMVTGQPLPQAEQKALDHGAVGLLHKPFDEASLMELLASIAAPTEGRPETGQRC